MPILEIPNNIFNTISCKDNKTGEYVPLEEFFVDRKAKLLSVKCTICESKHHNYYKCSNCGCAYGYTKPIDINYCKKCGYIISEIEKEE